jgi:hypothetical protein
MAREIFRVNGRYEFCDVVIDQDQTKPFHERTMIVRDPLGHEFKVKPMYGTWGEVREWDEPQRVVGKGQVT